MQPPAAVRGAHAVPIDRIPVELLSIIVKLALTKSERIGSDRNPEHTITYYGELRCLRLVAIRWCSIIDRAPELWTYVDPFAPEKMWRMALTKSQRTAIDVDCLSKRRPKTARIPHSFIPEFSNHAQRIASLKMAEGDLEDLGADAENATRLHCLLIRHQVDIEVNQRTGWTRMPLTEWAPNLRKLQLFICSLDLPRTGWTSLEALELCGQQPFDTLQILSILAESPKLKDLRIHGSFASPGPGQVQPPQVHLSALETLVTQLEPSEGSLQFLDSIVAAPTVTAYIAFALGDAKIESTWIRTLGRFAAGLKRSPAYFHIDVYNEYWGVLSPDLKIRFAMRLLRSVEECIQKTLEGVGEWFIWIPNRQTKVANSLVNTTIGRDELGHSPLDKPE